jgi:hypothetical protein
MSKKKGNSLETGHHTTQEYLRHCRSHEQYSHERQAGSHVHIFSKSGHRVTIPDHRGDLKPKTEASIRSQMKLAGFLVLLLIGTTVLLLLL